MPETKFIDQIHLSELEEIILSVLSKTEPAYGVEIARRIRVGSNESLDIDDGSLYPALKRLKSRKYVAEAPKPKRQPIVATRKYYVITDKGANQLKLKQTLRQNVIYWRIRDV